MIRSFRHRGLRALYEGRTVKRVSPQHVVRLRDILAVLDRSQKSDDMNLPGFRLHPLKGELKGHWAVWVSGTGGLRFAFRKVMHTMRIISTITRTMSGKSVADADA
jgi:toxin HigB-1